jgi:hypothetical protein
LKKQFFYLNWQDEPHRIVLDHGKVSNLRSPRSGAMRVAA